MAARAAWVSTLGRKLQGLRKQGEAQWAAPKQGGSNPGGGDDTVLSESVGGAGVDEGVDAAGEQGEARRRGAPLAGMANSSPVETPSGSPATSCGRV